MFRTLFFYSYFVFSLIFKLPKTKKLDKLKSEMNPLDFDKIVHEANSEWSGKLLKIAGADVKIIGIENLPKDSNMLFVSNHESNFDIPLLINSIPVPKGFIAKNELEHIPILSKWMTFMNCLFLDRNNIKQSGKVMLEAIKLLKSGHSLVIFPEGTRSKSNNIGEFKSGALMIATKANVPVVPLTIENTYKLCEANNNFIRPAKVRLTIHPPVIVSSLSKEETASLTDSLRTTISAPLSNSTV